MSVSIVHARRQPVKAEPPDNPRMTNQALLDADFKERLAWQLAKRIRTIAEQALDFKMTTDVFAERIAVAWEIANNEGVALQVLRRLTAMEEETTR